MNMIQNHEPPQLPGPLSPVPDMSPRWLNTSGDFDTAAQQIVLAHKNDGEARDVPVIDLRNWGIVPLGQHFGLAPLARNHPPRLLRHTAFSALMTRLGAPTEFVRDKLPAPLQLALTNYLLSTQERPLPAQLRLRGDQIAALVSERYAALDPEELLTAVRDALDHQGLLSEVEVKSIASGPVDVVRLILPSEQRPIKVGDISALGLDISTSSFGKSAVRVQSIVWRLRCTNGLKTPESQGCFSFRHVGESQRLRDGIGEAIPSALLHAQGVMQRWQASVRVMVEDVAAQIEAMRELTLGEKQGLRQSVTQEAGAHLLPERTDLYTMINGLTAMAREATLVRRLELETMAGELLADRTRTA